MCLTVIIVDVNQTYCCPENHLIFSCSQLISQHIAALRADPPSGVIALVYYENVDLIDN